MKIDVVDNAAELALVGAAVGRRCGRRPWELRTPDG
jgi:hypothetical protein